MALRRTAMKIASLIFLSVLIAQPSSAGFEPWTNKDGKTVSLSLISASGEGDAIEGKFRMMNGKVVTIKGADLDAAGLGKLQAAAAAKPTAEPAAAGADSVFDKVLEGNLVKLDGKSLKPTPLVKPTKYYIFYYTASWCGPCQAFTPSLVEFYNQTKPGNGNFELVLITNDSDQDDMTKYAVAKSMPWPQLKFSKVEAFTKKFDHGVSGIPAVIVCDLEGKIVAQTRDLNAIKDLVK
jgi:nucleoredoxin